MAHAVRAGRRLRRLERASRQQWLDTMTEQERVYYLRLLRRIDRDGLESVTSEQRQEALALISLVSGEQVCG
jgi:hypothetical protein